MKLLRHLLLGLGMCAASCVANAHRFHAGLTEIIYNDHSGNIEIVHSFTAHDIEAVLTDIEHRQVDLDQKSSETVLQRYIEKQFVITGPNKQGLSLHWIGMRLDAEKIIIFQEVKNKKSLKNYVLRNQILIDRIASQFNTVNFIKKSKRYSQLFTNEQVTVLIAM